MKRSGLKSRRRPPAKSPSDRLQSQSWFMAVTRTRCVMCRRAPVAREIRDAHWADLTIREGHHVIAQRFLKVERRADKLWDLRNGMCLCRWHHARHESHAERVPRAALPAAAVQFARELGLEWLLDREYPA